MPKFTWDKANRRYVDAKGNPVPDSVIREWIDSAVDDTKDDIGSIADELIGGEIDGPEWKQKITSRLRAMHTGVSLIAAGGLNHITDKALGRINAKLIEQDRYLVKFSIDIETGIQQKDGTLKTRAELYADAGVGTYEYVKRGEKQDAGFDEERSILDDGANHCEDCPAEAAAGWVPIGSLTPIGGRECLARCRCSIEYRKGPTASASEE
jgi:hypothetical protein